MHDIQHESRMKLAVAAAPLVDGREKIIRTGNERRIAKAMKRTPVPANPLAIELIE